MNLEHLRKQAKDRLKAARRTDRDVKLSGVQHQLARELGFASWPRMKAYLERDAPQHAYHDDIDYYADRAFGLLASVEDGTASAQQALAGRPATIDGARQAVALAHGFPSWPALRRHVRRLPDSGEPFAAAYRAIESYDPDALRTVLDRWPQVVDQQGTNGNDLLAMATATCDDRSVALLLERGADPNHPNAHGWTAMHQIAYAGAMHLLPPLLQAGGRTDRFGRGDGGTPMIVAIWKGRPDMVDALMQAGGIAPRNLRAAAGAGEGALVDELVGTSVAGAHRGFYRPHSGFPLWTARDDAQEVLDEALAFAARCGRSAILRQLAGHGAGLDSDVYRGTPLIWAAAHGQADAVRTLLDLGADPNARGGFGGESHGNDVTPLHLAGASGDEPTVRLLLDAGAERDVLDGHGYGTPASWAAHDGHDAIARLIRGSG